MNYPILTTDSATALIDDTLKNEILRKGSSFNTNETALAFEAARRKCEEITGRSFINQTWTYVLDDWPQGGIIYLPKGKLQSITTFSYRDADGTVTALVAGTDYYLENGGDEGRLYAVSSWPSVHSSRKGNITIEYVAGFGSSASDVDDNIRYAVALLARSNFDPDSKGDTTWKVFLESAILHFDYSRNEP